MAWSRGVCAVLLLLGVLTSCMDATPEEPVVPVTGSPDISTSIPADLALTSTPAPTVQAVAYQPLSPEWTRTPVLVPTYTPTGTTAPKPTQTPSIPDDATCSTDLQFFMVGPNQGYTQLTLSAEGPIAAPEKVGEGWVDFGGDLQVWINGQPGTDVRSALFDAKHPERLYILTKMVKPGYAVTVRLHQPDGWHCIDFKVPLPVPLPTSTRDPESPGT